MDVDLAPGIRRRTAVAFSVATCCFLPGAPSHAQTDQQQSRHSTRWALVDAVGYGGLGTLLGTAVAFTQSYETITPPASWFASIGAGAALGLATGAAIGGNAQRKIEQGRPVSPTHRGSVKFGAVMAGACVGALASVPIISGSAIQADEAVLATLAVSGGALGGMFASRHDEELTSYRFTVAPAHVPRAGYGVRVAFAF